MKPGLRTSLLLACALAPLGCQGEGSDIGPRFVPLPSASSKVNVFDDQNRGVVGAEVTLVDAGATAFTGRNGRGELFSRPSGRPLLRVDGALAAATAGDRLGTLWFRAPAAGGDVLTSLHLPDVAASQVVAVPVGQVVGPLTLANPLDQGGELTLPAGTQALAPGGVAAVELRSGVLQAVHLPGDLPIGNAILFGRGVYIDPPDVTFTPGADLRVDNDLQAAGVVTLYRLDPFTGEWTIAGTGTATGAEMVATGAVTAGGLYVFGAPVTGGAVRGRIVDAYGNGLSDALVSVDGRRTVSSGGDFLVGAVPATLADGSPREAVIEVCATGHWLPAYATATVSMDGSNEVAAGEVVLDTLGCTNIRVQQVTRSVAQRRHPARLSSLRGAVAVATTSDDEGQAVFEDMPVQWFGFQDAFPRDRFDTYYAQAVGYAEPGLRWLDAFQYFGREPWATGSRSSRVLASDAIGGGPLYGAILVRGRTAGQGYFGTTRESGTIWAERSLDERVTGIYTSERDGRTMVHAFTIEDPNGEHIELPMRQVWRQPLGAFDRHGIAQGTVTGSAATSELRLRTTRRLEPQDWWDQAFEGAPIRSSLPVDLAPAAAVGAFRCGVDSAGGHVVVAEVDATSGSPTLAKVAFAFDLVPVPGVPLELAMALDLASSQTFAVPGPLQQLDAAIDPADLAFDLALERPDGGAVDVVQGIAGNLTATGADVSLLLPPLTGALAGSSWLVALGGAATLTGGERVEQRCLLRLDGATPAPVQLLALPTIGYPTQGAIVPESGFIMTMQLPVGAQYGTVELRSDSGDRLLLWQGVTRAESVEFAFPTLPTEATSPLEAGRSYQLTLSAYAAHGGPIVDSEDQYRDLTTYYQSIGPIERGAVAVSRLTIDISTP